MRSRQSVPSAAAAKTLPDAAWARWRWVGLLLLCSLPVVLAYYAFRGHGGESKLEIGSLIVPARPMVEALAHGVEGERVALERLKGQWLLVTVASGACAPDCRHQLRLQQQLRESLGSERGRVDCVWLVNDNSALDRNWLSQLSKTRVLRLAAGDAHRWLGAPVAAEPVSVLYLVDPRGYAMARFPAAWDAQNAIKVRRVLERVLRATAAWDAPGRSVRGG